MHRLVEIKRTAEYVNDETMTTVTADTTKIIGDAFAPTRASHKLTPSVLVRT